MNQNSKQHLTRVASVPLHVFIHFHSFLLVKRKAMALVVLLFSFLVQHQLAQHTHSQLDGPSHVTTPPVLLGRALYGPADKDTEQRSRKLRDV